jgi:hypothetical protein
MLKALMPVAVFSVGCVFGTEKFAWPTMLNMILVTVGVAVASFGEINFNLVGVFYQMCSIMTESVRLVLVQILLQSRGLKLNPITTLYYVAPCCFGFLLLPFFSLELGKIMNAPGGVVVNPMYMLFNAIAANESSIVYSRLRSYYQAAHETVRMCMTLFLCGYCYCYCYCYCYYQAAHENYYYILLLFYPLMKR